MHRLLLAGLLLLSACHSGRAPEPETPSPIWGNLETGSYRVGLSVLFARDTTRPGLALDSTSIPQPGRPMQIVGMSNGSIAAMALQLSGLVPEAVVSLDGGIGEGAGGTYLGERSQGVPTRFTVPLLHLYGPDNPHLDFQYLRSYEASERLLVEVDHLRHRDFLTGGALEPLMPGAFGEAPPRASLGFEVVCRYTDRFLEWRLAGNAQAGAYLAAAPEAYGIPADLLTIERLPALVDSR
jgi:hypothetical protein